MTRMLKIFVPVVVAGLIVGSALGVGIHLLSKDSSSEVATAEVSAETVLADDVASGDVASATDPATPVSNESAQAQPDENGLYPPILVIDGSASSADATEKEWALAMSATLFEVNGERHDLLGGCEPVPENVRICNDVLAGGWGIKNRADLLGTLEWIEQGGHRREFDTVAYALSQPGGLEELREWAGNNPEGANKIAIAQRYADDLGDKSISSWDFGRYMFLCRRGYLGGYLTEDEAWDRIIPAAHLMHDTFSSWEDLGENYLIGREYWSLQQTEAKGARYEQAHQQLLSHPESPWKRLNWDL